MRRGVIWEVTVEQVGPRSAGIVHLDRIKRCQKAFDLRWLDEFLLGFCQTRDYAELGNSANLERAIPARSNSA